MEARIAEGLLWYVAFMFAMVVHEAAHAWAAMKLGDATAHGGGQVTLNPVPHMRREPVGTIVVPVISYLAGGWMFGWASTPYDPAWARRHPDRSALMALAGPSSNLLMVLSAGILIRIGVAAGLFYAPERVNFTQVTLAYQDGTMAGVATLLSIVFTLNLILFVFNLLPVPPLDGSGMVPLFLSKDRAIRYMDFMHNNPAVFLGIFLAWNVFDYVFSPVHLAFINMLYPGAGYH